MTDKKIGRPLELLKFDLDIIPKTPSSVRKNSAMNLSMKRMKYCFKKMSSQKGKILTPDASISYNDSTYFDSYFNSWDKGKEK